MTDWIAYLEAEPKSEPYLSIAAEWRADKARLAEAEASRDRFMEVVEAQLVLLDSKSERLSEAERLLRFVGNLIGESSGVYGFHLNGDLETWDYWPESAEIAAFASTADSADAGSCTHVIHDGRHCSMCGAAVTVTADPTNAGEGK